MAIIVAISKKHLHGYRYMNANGGDGQAFDVLVNDSGGTACWRGFLIVLYTPACDLIASHQRAHEF